MQFDRLLERHGDLWRQATQHPFLDGIRDGTLPGEALDTWLAQDYLFVTTALQAQADLLARAPRADQALLIGGLAALESELTWFETHLRSRDLDLAAPLTVTGRAYGDFLRVMAAGPYPAGIVVTATLERAYLEAWSGARPGAPAYCEFVEHWTTDAFRAYIDALVAAADNALSAASPHERVGAEEAFIWTARYERDFWQMAFG